MHLSELTKGSRLLPLVWGNAECKALEKFRFQLPGFHRCHTETQTWNVLTLLEELCVLKEPQQSCS